MIKGGRKRPVGIFLLATCPLPWHISDSGRILLWSQLQLSPSSGNISSSPISFCFCSHRIESSFLPTQIILSPRKSLIHYRLAFVLVNIYIYHLKCLCFVIKENRMLHTKNAVPELNMGSQELWLRWWVLDSECWSSHLLAVGLWASCLTSIALHACCFMC